MKNLKTNILIVAFFTILAIGVFLLLELFIEPKVTNLLTRIVPQKQAPDNVVMVMIDQKSIDRIRFPWRRRLYANIVEYLNDYGKASVVVFDSMISSPDNDFLDSDKYFYKTIAKYDNFVGAISTEPNLADDAALDDENFEKVAKKSAIQVDYQYPLTTSPFQKLIKIRPEYIDSVSRFGSVTVGHDLDTYIRSVFPIIRIKDKNYPLLGFAAYAKHKNLDKFVLTDKYLCSADDCKTLKIRTSPNIFGPKMRLKWYKRIDDYTTHKTYSAIDIIDSYNAIKAGKKPIINPEVFNEKIIIIGGYAAKVKSLEDIKSTPIIDNTHAGVDIQATVISNLLENESMVEISPVKNSLIVFFTILISVFIITTFGLTSSLITLLLLMLIYLIIAIKIFIDGTVIPIISPLAMILLVVSAGYTFRFLIEGKKKEQIQNAMGMYISKDIMKSVVKNIDNLQLGGKRANISVLFADIRGFTSISEQLSAEEVTEILNEYFSAVEPVIRKHNGVLNKFIGDAVLAIFGEPIQDKNHALNAVLCANEMHEVMDKLKLKWDLEEKPHIEIGIAINTGEAFVGNIGSPERIEYTVIGDTVNTASRIEAYNKVYKTRFLISESTYEKVSRICDVIKIREVSIRGKSRKITIYEVLRVVNQNDQNK